MVWEWRRGKKPMPKQPERLGTVQGLDLAHLEEEVHEVRFRLEFDYQTTLLALEEFCHSLRMAGGLDNQTIEVKNLLSAKRIEATVPLAMPGRSEDDDSRG